jgi:hypothetical protein
MWNRFGLGCEPAKRNHRLLIVIELTLTQREPFLETSLSSKRAKQKTIKAI